jgi:hypothetical protein
MMSSRFVATALVLLGLLLSGCELFSDDGTTAPTASSVGVTIRTTQTDYTLSEDLVIDVHFNNLSTDTLYYDLCGAVFLEEVAAGRIVGAWQLRYLACFAMADFPSGAQATWSVDGQTLLTFAPDAQFDDTRLYRLRLFPFFKSRNFRPDNAVDTSNQRSNLFRLRRAQP